MGKPRKAAKTVGARQTSKAEKKESQGAVKKNYTVKQPITESETKSNQKQVRISPSLEKELLKVIQQLRQESTTGDVSTRFTSKKLTDMYTSLQETGFTHEQIASCLSNTVPYGGDINSALDWLCLNLPDDQLPDGFSNAFYHEEKQKVRQYFDGKQVDLSNMKITLPAKAPTSSASAGNVQKSKPEVKSSMKSWILNYAELDSDQSDDDEQSCDTVSEQTTDPNAVYLGVIDRLLAAKTRASEAKTKGDKDAQREVSLEIRKLIQEQKDLEKSSLLDESTKHKGLEMENQHEQKMANLKICDIPHTAHGDAETMYTYSDETVGNVPDYDSQVGPLPRLDLAEDEEDEDDNFASGLFSEENKQSETTETLTSKLHQLESRRFEYTQQQWTGKSPKQFFLDWCNKHLGGAKKPKFSHIKLPHQLVKCQLTVYRKKEADLDITPDIACYNIKEAEHLACTRALFILCKGQAIYQLLPPPYRDIYQEWLAEEKKTSVLTASELNKPRDDLVKRLMSDLLQKPSSDITASKETVSSTSGSSKYNDFTSKSNSYSNSIDKRKPSMSMIQHIYQKHVATLQFNNLLSCRQQLPVFGYRDKIIKMLRTRKVMVISGETGCGKSTQIPQFVLESCIERGEDCKIIVTEPRRISATSLATRVCDELGENRPGTPETLCGYQIRFETRVSDITRLTYCTTGVLLRKLQGDTTLKDVTHVIVDEVHERSMQSDFLITILKHLRSTRPDLHIILMSATIDSQLISDYFARCPVINVPGRTFPVDVLYLEDVIEKTGYIIDEDSPCCIPQHLLIQEQMTSLSVSTKGRKQERLNLNWSKDDVTALDTTGLDETSYCLRTRNTITRLKVHKINFDLIIDLIKYIESDPIYSCIEGGILIFLPGLAPIQQLYDLLTTDKTFTKSNRYKILALHSVLSSDDQSAAFSTPARGVRKVILSTNIAETGVTIPDIVFVIDTGKAKELRYSESSQISSLEEVFVSKASAKQRRGRAGRIREGFCFRLYTRLKYESFDTYSVPEIKRVPLEELCLHIMRCNFGAPGDFLSQVMEPPSPVSVSMAMHSLQEIGACRRDSDTLTPLGQHLSQLPVHVRLGKMLIFGAIFGCLPEIAVIAAAMTVKSPFMTSVSKQDDAIRAKKALSLANSDHLTLCSTFIRWLESKRKSRTDERIYCEKHCLKSSTLFDIDNVRQELLKLIQSIGFCDSQTTSTKPKVDEDAIPLIKAVLVAGLYPNIATAMCTGSTVGDKVCTLKTAQGDAKIHRTSVNNDLQTDGWLVYHEKMKQRHVYITDSTLISAYSLLLFGGALEVQHTHTLVTIDEWIRIKASARTGVLFKESQKLLDILLSKKLQNPSLNIADNGLVVILKKLLQERLL